jgi:hypothetical protein
MLVPSLALIPPQRSQSNHYNKCYHRNIAMERDAVHAVGVIGAIIYPYSSEKALIWLRNSGVKSFPPHIAELIPHYEVLRYPRPLLSLPEAPALRAPRSASISGVNGNVMFYIGMDLFAHASGSYLRIDSRAQNMGVLGIPWHPQALFRMPVWDVQPSRFMPHDRSCKTLSLPPVSPLATLPLTSLAAS